MGFFTFGSNNMALGIDIGTSAIKIVQLKKTASGTPELVNYGYAPLPQDVMGDGVVDVQTVSEILKDVLKTRKLKASRVFASISGQNVIMRFTKLPIMDPSEMESTVKIEAEQYVPYSIDEVSITHAVLKTDEDDEEGGGGKYKILLVVAQKELVNSYIEALKSGAGKPEIIDVDTIAAINALEDSFMMTADSQEGGEVVAIIDSGARTTNISVLKSGVLEFTRNIPIAGNNITTTLKENLKQEFDQAESIKIEEGSIEAESAGNEVSEVILSTVDELTNEIRRSFDYYKAQSREPMIHRVILSGGSANLKGFSTFLMNELGVDVNLGNPLEGISINVPDPDELYSNLQQFTVSIGLALRGVKDD